MRARDDDGGMLNVKSTGLATYDGTQRVQISRNCRSRRISPCQKLGLILGRLVLPPSEPRALTPESLTSSTSRGRKYIRILGGWIVLICIHILNVLWCSLPQDRCPHPQLPIRREYGSVAQNRRCCPHDLLTSIVS